MTESSSLMIDQDVEKVLDFYNANNTGIPQDQFMQSFPQKIDCCQEMDMSSCLMGCYFVPLDNNIVIHHLKTKSPLDLLISWHSYFIVSENPPPRWFV